MPTQQPRIFSREFKEAAVRRILAGEKVKALATELQVWPKLLYHWWDRYEWGGLDALVPPGRPPRSAVWTQRPRPAPRVPARKAKKAHRAADAGAATERVAELERKIGQQALELDFFARALRHVRASVPRNDGRGAKASSP